jgi:selenocysteine lyase/cysteine desulfurase
VNLDLAFARSQFPAFSEPSLNGQAFFENAGGSYACRQVIDRFAEYYRRLKVQPYYRYPAATEAGDWMDAAHARLAEYVNVNADEIHFGPSTSQNTYVLAMALRKLLRPGDEIIVTNQDHEANTGMFRRLVNHGMILREWRVGRDSGLLEVRDFDRLLSDRTRLVTIPHCSNVVAQINPVKEIVAKARAARALAIVDGVALAPHGLPDVDSIGADIYLFSLYKTYGPHQGVMVVRDRVFVSLGNEGHYFNAPHMRKRLVPAGPDHAQIAATRGVPEYFDALDAHHGGGDPKARPQRVRDLMRGAEIPLAKRLLDYLKNHKGVRLIGSSDATLRAPTVSFVPLKQSPGDVQAALGKLGIMSGAGHFYGVRLLEAMGVDPNHGVVRLSFVHYTSDAEMTQLLRALDQVLGAAA